MVYHPEAHYQNIHFVESEESWHREIQAKQGGVKLHNELYDDFHKLSLVIHSPQPTSTEEEGPKWPTKQRHVEPEATCPATASTSEPVDEPLYINGPRCGSSKIPVENDERDPTGSRPSSLRGSSLRSHDIVHPSPPPPPLPARRDNNTRRPASMRDRPLPAVPSKDDDVAKVKKTSTRSRPTNQYVADPIRQQPQQPRRVPPLPKVTKDKLERSKRYEYIIN